MGAALFELHPPPHVGSQIAERRRRDVVGLAPARRCSARWACAPAVFPKDRARARLAASCSRAVEVVEGARCARQGKTRVASHSSGVRDVLLAPQRRFTESQTDRWYVMQTSLFALVPRKPAIFAAAVKRRARNADRHSPPNTTARNPIVVGRTTRCFATAHYRGNVAACRSLLQN